MDESPGPHPGAYNLLRVAEERDDGRGEGVEVACVLQKVIADALARSIATALPLSFVRYG